MHYVMFVLATSLCLSYSDAEMLIFNLTVIVIAY